MSGIAYQEVCLLRSNSILAAEQQPTRGDVISLLSGIHSGNTFASCNVERGKVHSNELLPRQPTREYWLSFSLRIILIDVVNYTANELKEFSNDTISQYG